MKKLLFVSIIFLTLSQNNSTNASPLNWNTLTNPLKVLASKFVRFWAPPEPLSIAGKNLNQALQENASILTNTYSKFLLPRCLAIGTLGKCLGYLRSYAMDDNFGWLNGISWPLALMLSSALWTILTGHQNLTKLTTYVKHLKEARKLISPQENPVLSVQDIKATLPGSGSLLTLQIGLTELYQTKYYEIELLYLEILNDLNQEEIERTVEKNSLAQKIST